MSSIVTFHDSSIFEEDAIGSTGVALSSSLVVQAFSLSNVLSFSVGTISDNEITYHGTNAFISYGVYSGIVKISKISSTKNKTIWTTIL